jgi:hypothetical protein
VGGHGRQREHAERDEEGGDPANHGAVGVGSELDVLEDARI